MRRDVILLGWILWKDFVLAAIRASRRELLRRIDAFCLDTLIQSFE